MLAALAPTALAQLEILQPPPTLPGLPEPPLLSHALLENPIPPVILAIALSLGAYAVLTRLGRRRQGALAAGAGVLFGVVILSVALAIETPREQVQARTRELVAAVAHADGPALDRLLAADARLYVKASSAGWKRPAIIDWVETNLAPDTAYAVESHSVGEVQAEIKPSGSYAQTRATVTVTPTQSAPTRCICMLAWQRVGDEWLVVEIEPLWLQGWGEISSEVLRETPRW